MKKVYVFLWMKNGREYNTKIFKTKKAIFEYSKTWGHLDDIGRNKFYKDMEIMADGYTWKHTKHYAGLTDEDLAFNGLTASDIANPTELYGGMDVFNYSVFTRHIN